KDKKVTEGEKSGCEELAAYAAALAAKTKSTKEFLRQFGHDLAGFSDGLKPEWSPGSSPVKLGATGFRAELYDGDDHPARHFAASVITGYRFGFLESAAVAHIREIGPGRSRNIQDVRLGVMGSLLGNALREGRMTKEQISQWILDNL